MFPSEVYWYFLRVAVKSVYVLVTRKWPFLAFLSAFLTSRWVRIQNIFNIFGTSDPADLSGTSLVGKFHFKKFLVGHLKFSDFQIFDKNEMLKVWFYCFNVGFVDVYEVAWTDSELFTDLKVTWTFIGKKNFSIQKFRKIKNCKRQLKTFNKENFYQN